jgi:hypothetical protein
VQVTAAAVELPSLETRISWFDDWEEQTRTARKDARRDRWYYDNVQWTAEEVAKLEARKQPVLTKNRIARKVNFILGEEIRKRVDPVARPRTPQHEDAARSATDALRYVEEEQEFDKARSAVLKNVLIEGMGGALKGLEETEDDEYKHTLQHIEWDRLAYDPHSRAPDFGDAKWLAIVLWMDLDDAIIRWPDAAEVLREAVTRDIAASDDTTEDVPRKWTDRKRNRVKVVEMYARVDRDWYRFVFTSAADVEQADRTPYLNERGTRSVCPLVLMSCYIDPNGNRYGIVRQLISPQDEINKRSSKALHFLNTRQVIAERDAVADPQKFQTELAKPDGYAEVEPGSLTDGRLQVQPTSDLAQGQITLLQEAKQDIDTIGPSLSSMPDAAASSGREFIARQQAAAQELGTIFDQLRNWTKQVFSLDWLCIRQYWTEEKWLRITDDRELTGYRFTALNQRMTRAQRLQDMLEKQAPLESALQAAAGEWAPLIMSQVQQAAQAMAAQAQQAGQQMPEGEEAIIPLVLQHPLMAEEITVNQVDQMLVDIIIEEAPETAVIEQEEFEKLSEIVPVIVQARPDMAPSLAKAMIRASQLRDKQDLLEELDKAPDPQQQQQQQQAQQMQQAMAEAGIAVQQTKAQLQQAQTAKTQAEAQALPVETQAKVESTQAQTWSAHSARVSSLCHQECSRWLSPSVVSTSPTASQRVSAVCCTTRRLSPAQMPGQKRSPWQCSRLPSAAASSSGRAARTTPSAISTRASARA